MFPQQSKTPTSAAPSNLSSTLIGTQRRNRSRAPRGFPASLEDTAVTRLKADVYVCESSARGTRNGGEKRQDRDIGHCLRSTSFNYRSVKLRTSAVTFSPLRSHTFTLNSGSFPHRFNLDFFLSPLRGTLLVSFLQLRYSSGPRRAAGGCE